ncbi:MAG: hypothetical protein JNM17_20140 [Archangium sp.]|nr:hypothetical protein [Archangium sp.]
MKAAGFIGVFLLALVGLCIAPCVPHQLKLSQHERKYRAIQHPPSRALAYEADVGLLEGNGNHCDYFAGELRATKLTFDEVRAAYRGSADIDEADPTTPPSYVSSPRDRLLAFATRAQRAAGERLYVVSIYDQEEPGFDMRCH